MIFCFLCQRPLSMMLPYTSTSLKRKKALGCGPRRLCFISRPSPIRTLPGWNRVFPDGPNEFSTVWIRSRFSWENARWSTMMSLYLSPVFSAAVFLSTVPRLCWCEVSLLYNETGSWAWALKASVLGDAMGFSRITSALRQTYLASYGREQDLNTKKSEAGNFCGFYTIESCCICCSTCPLFLTGWNSGWIQQIYISKTLHFNIWAKTIYIYIFLCVCLCVIFSSKMYLDDI